MDEKELKEIKNRASAICLEMCFDCDECSAFQNSKLKCPAIRFITGQRSDSIAASEQTSTEDNWDENKPYLIEYNGLEYKSINNNSKDEIAEKLGILKYAYEQTRKETAKEILQKVYDEIDYYSCQPAIQQFAAEYGVEVE